MQQHEDRKDFDLERFLHPAGAFRTPLEVVNDPDMTTREKRAILASWASDAWAVEAAPELRQPPSAPPVRFVFRSASSPRSGPGRPPENAARTR